MRTHLASLSLVLLAAACSGGDDGGSGPDAPAGSNCPLPDTTADLGSVAALKAQRCNVNGSMGMRKWYRLSATMETGDIVQLDLYPNTGAFAAGAVVPGTFPVDTNFASCGVCLRAVGDKGTATAKEYFGTGGMVTITAAGTNGQPISATITNGTLAEVNPTSHVAIPSGCATTVTKITVAGTVMDVGGGGGGGGGGMGTGQCPTTVGD